MNFAPILFLNMDEKQRIFIVHTLILRISSLFLLSIGLIACSHVTITPMPRTSPSPSWPIRQQRLNDIENWELSGKIAVQTQRDSGSASLDWIQRRGQYRVALIAPLGAGGVTVSGGPGHVAMETTDGKHYTAQSPETLLAEHWGFSLPVSNLTYWVRGLPVPNMPQQTQFDSYNRLASLTQQGWNVQYLDYTQVSSVELPSRIFITSPSLKTRIVINTWKI